MTYQGQTGRATNTVMKVLVILAIAWIAYWAATGGLEQIPIQESAQSSSTTLSE